MVHILLIIYSLIVYKATQITSVVRSKMFETKKLVFIGAMIFTGHQCQMSKRNSLLNAPEVTPSQNQGRALIKNLTKN